MILATLLLQGDERAILTAFAFIDLKYKKTSGFSLNLTGI